MDSSEFERLAQTHLTALYSYCLSRVCNPQRAEELAQETLTCAFEAFHTLKDRRAFFPWLIGIAKRRSWVWWRKAKRDPLQLRSNPAGTDPPDSLLDQNGPPPGRLAAREKTRNTLDAVKKLPMKYREPIVLRYFEELSYAEIALRLGISIDTVDQRLTRAKLKLRRLLRNLEM